MRSLSVLAIITTVFLFSCSEDVEKRKMSDFSLNIVDAQSVAVIENPIGGRISETSDNLFKLTIDGSFEKIKFVNADGTDVDPKVKTSIEVYEVINLNSSYLFLLGRFSIGDQQYNDLLVRKQDGAIYSFNRFEYFISPGYDMRKDEGSIKYDAAGNIYFLSFKYSETSVGKLIVENPDALSSIDYLPTGQWAKYFDIDKDGNCIYFFDKPKVKKINGGIFQVNIDNRTIGDFWVGDNGLIYFVSHVSSVTNNPKDFRASMIHSINFEDDVASIDTVWNEATDYLDLSINNYSTQRIKRNNSTLFINGEQGEGSFMFFEDTKTVVEVSLPLLKQEREIVSSEQNYYIAFETDLYKVNFDTHEYVKLFKTGEYEVYSLNVDDNDKVFFSGLRYKDGKMIFAEIDSEGNLTIVDEELDKKATMLQRLN